ncbi:hypothetical protein Tco_0058865 [Tanacetum coccineum]
MRSQEMRKVLLLKQEFSEFRICEAEGLPQRVALTIEKTIGGLELLSLMSCPSLYAFVSTLVLAIKGEMFFQFLFADTSQNNNWLMKIVIRLEKIGFGGDGLKMQMAMFCKGKAGKRQSKDIPHSDSGIRTKKKISKAMITVDTLLLDIFDDQGDGVIASKVLVMLENLLSWVSLPSPQPLVTLILCLMTLSLVITVTSLQRSNHMGDLPLSDSSVKSSEPKSNDSTSCASTSSISTSESEAEIESNVGTPIQETINVQDLPSFSCNSSDKNGNTSRTSCNKNGYINKKAGHFRKNASSVSKLCFVCGSSTHLIKDCDFYEKQMANKTVGNGVGPVHSRNNVNHQNQYVPHAVLLRTRKVNITPARPQPVPTGKPKVPTPVPTGRQNRPIPVPTGRVDSPSVTSGWWKSTARPMPHLNRPTSSYFQTYTPYVPQVYSNHMQYGGVRWATDVKPSIHKTDPSHKWLGSPLDTSFSHVVYCRKILIQMLKIHTDDNVADLLTKAFDGPRVINSPCYHNKELASPEQTATAEVVPKSVAGSSFPAASSTLLPFDVQICAEVSCVQVKTQADWMLLYFNPQVPTGRVIVPAGKVIIIVSPGRVKHRLMLIED